MNVVMKGLNVSTKLVKKHMSGILTCFGVSGVVSTGILATYGTLQSIDRIDKWKAENEEEPNKKTVIKICAPCYIPATISGSLAIACIVGSHLHHKKIESIIGGLYLASEKALTEYRDEARKQIGKTAEERIRGAINQRCLDNNPVPKELVKPDPVVTTENPFPGQPIPALIRDSWCGDYFYRAIDEVKQAVNEVNSDILNGLGFVSVNDFREKLNLEWCGAGEGFGWDYEFPMKLIEPITTGVADNGLPCLVLEYRVKNDKGYYDV